MSIRSQFPRREIPDVLWVSQQFERGAKPDIEAETISALQSILSNAPRISGKTIGLTGPSRGIADIGKVLKTAIEFLRPLCKEVVLVAAMGTHGGGTTEGEIETLRDRLRHSGVDLDSLAVRVLANLETTRIGESDGVEVALATDVLSLDYLILCNRIKEHTDINWADPLPSGCYGLQSGLAKIAALGCSKLCAPNLHAHVPGRGLGFAVEKAARVVYLTGKILGGLAIVENAYDETAFISGISYQQPDQFMLAELELLQRSLALMPSLPFSEIDVLYCMWLGKDLSGQGMHTPTIGRSPNGYQQGVPWKPGMPSIWNIIGGRLTEGSHGNAIGVGNCEFATARLLDEVNWERTGLNSLGAFTPCQAKMPFRMNDDREALEVALGTARCGPDGHPRLVLTHSTLNMVYLAVSPNLLESVNANSRVEVVREAAPLADLFGKDNYLTWPEF